MSGSVSQPGYLGSSLEEFLELVSRAEPAPAGGSAAAVAVALAAGLCVMAARLSADHLADAQVLADEAEALRGRASLLVDEDALVYSRVIEALRADGETDAIRRRHRVLAALSQAAEVPMEVAEIGAAVAGIAAQLAEQGNPNLLGDAVTASLLAEAAVQSAGVLVTINLRASPDDDRHARAAAILAGTTESAGRARAMIAQRSR